MTSATIPYMATSRDEPISSTHGRASAESLSADAALMQRIGSGDDDALMEVYDRHAETLFGATVRFLGDREAAAEIVQEAFVACWRFAATFDSAAGSLRTWLLQIARNKALDRLRSESRRPKITQLHPSEGGDEALLDPLERLAHRRGGDDGDDPAVLLERGWTRAVVRTALSDLASHEREVVFLAYGDGLSQHEIAERLGVPLGTVKSRTRRGLAHLRQALSNVPGVAPERGMTDAAR